MCLNKLITDALGVLTISLVSLVALLGLHCICCSLYFQLQIRRRGSSLLSFFNGPSLTRITLILATIWWGFGEILRLKFLREKVSLFSSLGWQKDICKFYILSNLGFAEPTIFLMVALLLHAALQKRDSGTLSQRWNKRTIGYVLLFCFPIFTMQLFLILAGHRFIKDESNSRRTKMVKFFTATAYLTENSFVCTCPLMSTVIHGSFVILMIIYISFVGARLLSLVINKGLRRRVFLLIFSVVIFLPLRVVLLGVSVLLSPGNLVYEATVFLSFFMLLCCAVVGICMLVYLPVRDSLSLTDLSLLEVNTTPYDDCYSEGASVTANQRNLEGRNSDLSVKPGSILFLSMSKDEPPTSGGIGMVSSSLVHSQNQACSMLLPRFRLE